jgi:ribonuclease J
MSAPSLRFIPLGGVGTIGMNCAVLECEGRMLVIDAGIKIPQEDLPGVDQILPDFSHILDNRERVEGVVLTHGHDDHVGALPYLLSELPLPVHGTAFTLALARARVADRGRQAAFDGRQMLFGEETAIGPFRVTALAVTHSIPDAAALAIRTPAGCVLHTGDFKLDPAPLDGRLTDTAALALLGKEGVDLLLCDSTNAEREGRTGSESEVGGKLEEIMRAAPGRVFIATFSSHIHRIQQVYAAAARVGRRVVLEGRRLVSAARIARELGCLRTPPGVDACWEEVAREEDRHAVFLTTGSQGEPLSALSRILRGEHPGVEVRAHDAVIFSSRIIPGNELAVGRMVNELFRRGAAVHYREREGVHVSGHAAAGDLLDMLKLAAPRFLVPIHGEYRHLAAHARLAALSGFPRERIFLLEPGESLDICAGLARRGEKVAAGRLLADGDWVGDGDGAVVKERRRLAREGLVVVVAIPRYPVSVHSIGVAPGEEARRLEQGAAHEAEGLLDELRGTHATLDAVREELQAKVRSFYRRNAAKKPRVLAVTGEA